jgi:hypothetical protein
VQEINGRILTANQCPRVQDTEFVGCDKDATRHCVTMPDPHKRDVEPSDDY